MTSLNKICIHWTAGANKPCEVDLNAYHFLFDKDGKVLIRDCQVNQTFELSEILWRSTSINFLRTDNLKLKENILELVQPNKPNLKMKRKKSKGALKWY